jgi:hypothetical protein
VVGGFGLLTLRLIQRNVMDKETIGNIGDALAGVSVLATLTQILPPIAAAFAIIWTGIRMYEWFRFRVLGKRDKQTEVFK